MVRGVRKTRHGVRTAARGAGRTRRGVRAAARGAGRTRRGALLLAAALAVGGVGATGCGPETPPAPGGPASSTGAPSTPGGTPSAPGTPAPSTGAPSAPGTPAPSTSPPGTGSPTREPQAQEVLVEVVVNGGLAGVRNQLVVHHDGSWTSRSGTKPPRTGRMTPAETAELRAALEDPAYARVPARPTGDPVPDGFQYLITYRHRLVVAGDGERPPALQRVFAALPDGGPPTRP
ncbi:hypothetical protein [Streptomyces lateritius]|uniref:hypothetical protein n=1 Tax=Streptomyces lateritius TaxID=67313 RepID=UPI001C8B7A0A|nr:hypothetical protein [Streptomyces lateritius]MBX9422952.1 hypothetical protein [Streptomyces lateritius]